MNTDWRGFFDAPLWLVRDYLTVLQGEAAVPTPGRPNEAVSSVGSYFPD